jgi:hypothetical protein
MKVGGSKSKHIFITMTLSRSHKSNYYGMKWRRNMNLILKNYIRKKLLHKSWIKIDGWKFNPFWFLFGRGFQLVLCDVLKIGCRGLESLPPLEIKPLNFITNLDSLIFKLTLSLRLQMPPLLRYLILEAFLQRLSITIRLPLTFIHRFSTLHILRICNCFL